MQVDRWRESSGSYELRSEIKIVISCFLVILCAIYFKKKRTYNPPPTCKGWIPILGCAIDFGKSPLTFIGEKRNEVRIDQEFVFHCVWKKISDLIVDY